jgi:hexulose-6-phosphate isomerase
MKISISNWSFDPSRSLKDCMALAKDAGYDGFEVALGDAGEFSLESAEADAKAVRAAAEDVGIEISGVACGLYWGCSLTADCETERAKAKSVLRKEIEMAAWVGVDGILVVPGNVHASFIPDCPVVPYDVAWERATDAIGEAAPLAEERGVTIGVENVWNKFLLSPLEMARFIDQFESDRVGAYFDVGNVLLTGFPEQWIRILGKRISRVHFKDFRCGVGGLAGFVDLLSGDVNWPAVMAAFQEVGYDGWVTAEMIPPYTHHGDQIIYNTAEAMKRIVGR